MPLPKKIQNVHKISLSYIVNNNPFPWINNKKREDNTLLLRVLELASDTLRLLALIGRASACQREREVAIIVIFQWQWCFFALLIPHAPIPCQIFNEDFYLPLYLPLWINLTLYAICPNHRVHIFTRDETGLVCLPTQLERTLQLCR